VVSANAFDKGLENDVGIAVADFITKPIRHSELLDWLEQRLRLQWSEQAPPPVAPPAAIATAAPLRPRAEHLAVLREVVALGYYRGVVQELDAIEAATPHCHAWVEQVRALTRQYNFDAILELMEPAEQKT
jgi:FixJ family two-component response regulator